VSGASPCDNPLADAAEKGLTEAIKCLLDAGANPNVLDKVRILSIVTYSCVLLGFVVSADTSCTDIQPQY
jgi:hypothetical protein